MITFLDAISSTILLTTIILLLIRSVKSKKKSHFMLLIAFSFLFISTIFNFPEHLNSTARFDNIEVLFEILFLPTLILSIHITIINKELLKRKLSETKFKAIFNQALTLVGLLDREGKIIEANQTAVDMAGVKKEDVSGIPFVDSVWWSHSEIEKKKLTDAFIEAKKGKSVRFETYHLGIDNKEKPVDFTLKPIFNIDNELEYFIVEGRDISVLKDIMKELELHKNNLEELVQEKTEELKTTNEELIASNEELNVRNNIIKEQNNELQTALQNLKETQSQLVQSEKMSSIGIFTAGMAHEINNPLNIIMGGYTNLHRHLVNKENLSQDEIEISLKHIKSGIRRATEIIKNLKPFNKERSDYSETCQIHAIIDSCIQLMQSQYLKKIEIKKNYSSQLIAALGNKGELHQVFLNLFLNSIDAIGDKEGEIIITTNIENDKVIIEVSDNGCGIGEQDIDKVFSPFFTTKPPGRARPGLGLSIIYSIIKKHEGDIKIESKENISTTVTMLLPALKL